MHLIFCERLPFHPAGRDRLLNAGSSRRNRFRLPIAVLRLPIVHCLVTIAFLSSCMTFRKADSVMRNQFQQKGIALNTATIKIQGHNIHYAQTGADTLPTLVFIHGTPGSWDAFANYMQDPDLLHHYRMISVDRPGFGYSDFGNVASSLTDQSKLIDQALSKLSNNKPMLLAGHSLGGPLIVQMAADNPSLFCGLVIISGSVDPAKEKPEKWRPVIFKTPLNLLVPGAFRPSNEELWYLKKDLVTLKASFAAIRCPVFFIHGAADTWVPPGNVEYAKKLLVNTERIGELIIPGANHFIPWTKFKEIKEVLLQLPMN
jgi:pimeloyl-ACP methyl ester carboxylesterase